VGANQGGELLKEIAWRLEHDMDELNMKKATKRSPWHWMETTNGQ
jgi:hypothetical protein